MIDNKENVPLDPTESWRCSAPRQEKQWEDSWAGLFRHQDLCNLPVTSIAPYVKTDFGDATNELQALLGVLVLQQVFDLTDEESVNHLASCAEWQYALNRAAKPGQTKDITTRCLWSIRSVIIENKLESTVFKPLFGSMASQLHTNRKNQPTELAHTKTTTRNLGRVALISESITRFLFTLKNHPSDCFKRVPNQLTATHLPKREQALCSMVRPSESWDILESVCADLFEVVHLFKSESQVAGMPCYQKLEYVLNGQCNMNTPGSPRPFAIKPVLKSSSSVLRNPPGSDEARCGQPIQEGQPPVVENWNQANSPHVSTNQKNLYTQYYLYRTSPREFRLPF